jgi:hypothetical protein
MFRSRHPVCIAAAVLALAAFLPCGCVHEELRPVRETMLTVARSAGEVTLSFTGTRGIYYTVMYSPSNGARAKWQPLPDAVNIQVAANGESVIVKDRLPASTERYYRLVQGPSPVQAIPR